MKAELHRLIAKSTSEPVTHAITAMATHCRSLHPNTEVVLAYGSALRDSSPEDTLIDLYILTRDLGGVSSSTLSQLGCRMVPPNVYHAECEHDGRTYHAKYAVLPFSQFHQRVSPRSCNPYFWARFCQPSRVVWAASEKAKTESASALETAIVTAWRNAVGLAPTADWQERWETLFANTYRTELRPEADNRARLIVASHAAFYKAAATAMHNEQPISANWQNRRAVGKALSVVRLVKAAFTFRGGADYIAWKIKRHSGVEINVTDWMRHHPILAALWLLPRLLQKRAFR